MGSCSRKIECRGSPVWNRGVSSMSGCWIKSTSPWLMAFIYKSNYVIFLFHSRASQREIRILGFITWWNIIQAGSVLDTLRSIFRRPRSRWIMRGLFHPPAVVSFGNFHSLVDLLVVGVGAQQPFHRQEAVLHWNFWSRSRFRRRNEFWSVFSFRNTGNITKTSISDIYRNSNVLKHLHINRSTFIEEYHSNRTRT